MKSILIIGMGRFGHHLCNNLIKCGNQVMIVDQYEEKIEDLVSVATSAQICDCTNEGALKSLGVRNFDIVFVCIGTNFQSSLEVTSLVKELGAKYVISKATRDIHAKFLLRNGADEVVYPDRDIAEKLATRCSANNVFDYIELNDEYGIYEIPALREWVGKSIMDLGFRGKYGISILGIKKGEETKLLPAAGYVFCKDDHLMVIGDKEHIGKILRLFK